MDEARVETRVMGGAGFVASAAEAVAAEKPGKGKADRPKARRREWRRDVMGREINLEC
jgi:hypothetical protein